MCSPSPPPLFPPTALPQHLPHLIPAMQHYAWVLRTCHAGAELDTALTMCQGLVDDDLRWHLYDLAAHRDAWWAPGKVVELRHRLAPYWMAEGASRWGGGAVRGWWGVDAGRAICNSWRW